MASLSDRLDRVLGATAADALDEQFGMRTVDDLLRHYPRSYVEGAARVGIGDARPEAGEHITIVDVITDTYSFPMKKKPNRKCLRITVGGGRNKVTATFFNADYIMRDLTKHTKVMLSGEVGYYKGAMQLTHPAFLILDSPDGKNHGTRSLKSIADASKAISGELVGRSSSVVSSRSIRPAQKCRAGTSSNACGRCSMFSTGSMIRCPRNYAPSTA